MRCTRVAPSPRRHRWDRREPLSRRGRLPMPDTGRYADGVWIVDLAPLPEGSNEAAVAVAAALDLGQQLSPSAAETMVDYLGGRGALLFSTTASTSPPPPQRLPLGGNRVDDHSDPRCESRSTGSACRVGDHTGAAARRRRAPVTRRQDRRGGWPGRSPTASAPTCVRRSTTIPSRSNSRPHAHGRSRPARSPASRPPAAAATVRPRSIPGRESQLPVAGDRPRLVARPAVVDGT